jgi:hypothetical protein
LHSAVGGAEDLLVVTGGPDHVLIDGIDYRQNRSAIDRLLDPTTSAYR